MKTHQIAFTLCMLSTAAWAGAESYLSTGRAPDPTAKSISDIRAAERRRIPLEVALRAATDYSRKQPINVTIMVTNLFDEPLLLNRRMLVNHPRLEGEVSFRVVGPDGKALALQKPVTPLAVHDEDFML